MAVSSSYTMGHLKKLEDQQARHEQFTSPLWSPGNSVVTKNLMHLNDQIR